MQTLLYTKVQLLQIDGSTVICNIVQKISQQYCCNNPAPIASIWRGCLHTKGGVLYRPRTVSSWESQNEDPLSNGCQFSGD